MKEKYVTSLKISYFPPPPQMNFIRRTHTLLRTKHKGTFLASIVLISVLFKIHTNQNHSVNNTMGRLDLFPDTHYQTLCSMIVVWEVQFVSESRIFQIQQRLIVAASIGAISPPQNVFVITTPIINFGLSYSW